MTIGILTHGSEAPGVNAAIKAVVKKALEDEIDDVVGVQMGFDGILNLQTVPLDAAVVRTWDRNRGSELGVTRNNPFDWDRNGWDRSSELLEKVTKLGIDYLVVTGGDGTMRLTYALVQKGLKAVSIPRTIDDNVFGTDVPIGFDTAISETAKVIENVRGSAGSLRTIYVVETMGDSSGRLALLSGEAAGAVMILIPEYKYTMEQVVKRLSERRRKGTKYDIIVYAEGALPENPNEIDLAARQQIDPDVRYFVGAGLYFAKKLIKVTGNTNIKYQKIGYDPRGAVPSKRDRILAKRFGTAAVELIRDGKLGQMVALQQGVITSISLKDIVCHKKGVDVEKEYDTVRLTALRSGLGSRLY